MNWYLNLRMRTKLLSVFAVLCGMMLAVGLLGLRGMSDANRRIDELHSNEMAGLASAQDLRSLVLDVGRLYRQAIIDGAGPSARATAEKIDANLTQIAADVDALGKVGLDERERASLDAIKATLPDWKERLARTVALAASGDTEGARASAAGNGANAATLVKEMAALTASFNAAALRAVEETDRAEAATRRFVAIVVAIGLLVGIGMGIVVARVVSKPLGEAVKVLGAVAEGDFTHTLVLDTRDELGQMAAALDRAVTGMRRSLLEVRSSFEIVATASNELSASSESISAGAQEQASSLEETAASIEQITATVQQNAEHSQEAARIAQDAREIAEKGGAVVARAVGAMREIEASSKHIADIITTIDEIAFQTNLLALNAAVEAARAGDQGRGFAVVAGEVRVLAQRSASAAREIKSLIQDSVEKVEAGTELVNHSGATLEEIVTTVKRVTEIVGEIATASREQTTGITQVGMAITQMDQVTQSNAAQTEELAGTAESLSTQAGQLRTLVGRYRLGDGEGGETAAARPTPALVVASAPATKRASRPVHTAATGTDGHFEEF